MIHVPVRPPENVWAVASRLTSSKDQQTKDLDELLRQARDFNSEEALECLVQFTMHKDPNLSRQACDVLKQLQHGAVDGSDGAEATRRRQEQLKGFAFSAYQLAKRSKAGDSLEVGSIPVYVLHLAGSHARDRGWKEAVRHIEATLEPRLPGFNGEAVCGPARAITTDELQAVEGRKHGALMPYAGVLQIHPHGVVLQSHLGAEPVTDTLFSDVAEGCAKPVSLWLDNHYLHGFCTVEGGQRTLTLLDSAPDADDRRAAAIRAALPGVKQLRLHRQSIQQDVPNACGPIGMLLFDFCGQRGSAGIDTIQKFADGFDRMPLRDKQTALDGARADLLDACVRK